MYLEFNKTNVLKQGILISCKIKKISCRTNDDNVYSGVKFLNLVKKGRKIKIRIFIKE